MDPRRIYEEAYYHYCLASELYEDAMRRYPDLYNNVINAQHTVTREELRVEYFVYHDFDTTEVENRLHISKQDYANEFNRLLTHVYPEYQRCKMAKENYEDAMRLYYSV